jgi:hypothetical protein
VDKTCGDQQIPDLQPAWAIGIAGRHEGQQSFGVGHLGARIETHREPGHNAGDEPNEQDHQKIYDALN